MKDELKKYKVGDSRSASSANEAAVTYVSMPSPLKVISNVGRDDKHLNR